MLSKQAKFERIIILIGFLLFLLCGIASCINPYTDSYKRLNIDNGLIDQYIQYVKDDKNISDSLQKSRLLYAQALKLKAERITNGN